MTRALTLAVFAFLFWMMVKPAEIYVSPSLEAAAIRVIHEHTR